MAVRPLRIMTFNILAGKDIHRELNLERTADVIAAAEPDVVGLQEVDRHYGERSEWADQTAELAARLGWTGEFSPGLDLEPESGRSQRRQFGDAILTPHRMHSFTAHALTNLDGTTDEPRGAGCAEIEIDGHRLQVINTHLDHRSPEQRRHQALQVRSLLDATDGPAVVLGDLNARPDDPEVRLLSDGLRDAAESLDQAAALTYPSDSPTIRIDHIFARQLDPVRAVVLDVRASDHRPVLAEFSWQ